MVWVILEEVKLFKCRSEDNALLVEPKFYFGSKEFIIEKPYNSILRKISLL